MKAFNLNCAKWNGINLLKLIFDGSPKLCQIFLFMFGLRNYAIITQASQI